MRAVQKSGTCDTTQAKLHVLAQLFKVAVHAHLELCAIARELSPLQDEDDLAAGLVDFMQRHHVGVGLGHLQHGDLIQDVHAAVLALPPLSQTFGGVLLPRGLFYALLHHGKLSPGSRWRGGKKKTRSETTVPLFENENKKIYV